MKDQIKLQTNAILDNKAPSREKSAITLILMSAFLTIALWLSFQQALAIPHPELPGYADTLREALSQLSVQMRGNPYTPACAIIFWGLAGTVYFAFAQKPTRKHARWLYIAMQVIILISLTYMTLWACGLTVLAFAQ